MKITKIAAAKKHEKTRIAVYCRVSTTAEEQKDSLEIQKEAYRELISNRSDWELVKVYSDSISGLRAEKRPEFMQMIGDAMDGSADRILCKSVSRFSRNAAECKKYTDMLLTKNIGVEFEKEHLKTDDPTSSFLFSLMSAVAENESRSISENIRWGYRERFRRGEYNLGNNRILGYDSVDGKLVPNKDADAIRLIYDKFLKGSTIEEIRKNLANMGGRMGKGTVISRRCIYYILSNETYKGDKLLQKKPPRDFLTKKPNPLAEYESNYLTDDHEPIVDKAVWEAAQEKLAKNRETEKTVGHRGGLPHFLYGKVFCGECGEPMRRWTYTCRNGKKYKSWICRERLKGKKGNGCKERIVREEKLIAEICGMLGWKQFDKERFLREIRRVTVYEDRLELEKTSS